MTKSHSPSMASSVVMDFSKTDKLLSDEVVVEVAHIIKELKINKVNADEESMVMAAQAMS